VQQLPTTLTLFGGQFIVPPGKVVALAADALKSFGITAFDGAERAKAWCDPPAYQAIIPLRVSSAKSTAFLVQGAA
jgi:uncharacterized protein (DUF1330 family)